MNRQKLHRISGLLIGLFLLLHLFNHLLVFDSALSHIQFMEKARQLYRQPLVEVILLLAVAFQVVSGFVLFRKKRGHTLVDKLQEFSGLYLGIFLLNHVLAVLYARIFLQLDSNLYFAIAGMHTSLWKWFFVPYYMFSIVAFFTHIACYVSPRNKPQIVIMIAFIACLIAGFMMFAMLGNFYPIEIPAPYQAIYSDPA